MKKKIIIAGICGVFVISSLGFSYNNTSKHGPEYIFVNDDGSEVTYYMNEDKMPYVLDENGDFMPILLPLEHLQIKDERVNNVLDAVIMNNENDSQVLDSDATQIIKEFDEIIEDFAKEEFEKIRD